MSAAARGALVVALLALACAGGEERGARGRRGPTPAAAAVEALLAGGDPREAEERLRAPLARGGDPWAHLGAALLARRLEDGAAEVRHLADAAAAAPGGPVALVALRRLADLAEVSPDRAREVERVLAPALSSGRLVGLAAYRARVARVTAAEVLGDPARAAALRAENGAVSGWTLAGPFGFHHALDLDATFPPDEGVLPEAAPGPRGLPPRPTRPLPAPDGTAVLEGEPPGADVFFFAADVSLERGGEYLLTLGTTLAARVSVAGATVHERRSFSEHAPSLAHLRVALAAGTHRLVVKATRGAERGGLHVALARADGSASDARFAPAPPGPTPRPSPASAARVGDVREVAAALEAEAGPVAARLLAARDAANVDREGAKALLAEAALRAPGAPALLVARAAIVRDDPTLDAGVARARAEADLREALGRDPGAVEARLLLVELLRAGDRLDDAAELLAEAPPSAAGPRAAWLEARARVADARGLGEEAERLVAESLASEPRCGAASLGYALASRRRAIAVEDRRILIVAECRGRATLAEHLRRRGDARAAAEALAPLVLGRPWAVETALARADALLAAGDADGAARALRDLAAIWPRSPRVLERRADVEELAGRGADARALRERALLLDGADLALRRLLALEDGREVLDDLAEDGAAAIRAYEAARPRGATSSAMVLDAAAVEIHPGGAATERTHQIFHVLDQGGVEQLGEVTVPHGASVLRLRTLKPDGRAVEPERAGASKGSVSLAGLEPGDYVQVEHVRAVRGPDGGYVADPFFFQIAGTPLFRSSYVVAAPDGLGLAVDAHGMPAPAIARRDGREILRDVRTSVPAFVPEPNAPPMTEYLPFLQAGVGGGREAAQRGLADAAVERTKPTLELRALAREIREKAGPGAAPAALARAAYAEVARRVLGTGSGLAEDASVALSRGRGSRLGVLRVVLDELGLAARLALARPFAADQTPWTFGDAAQFGQPLLRVTAGGETFWLDPTQRLAPFGAIPSGVLDVEALVLPLPGEPLETARTPARALVEEGRTLAIRVALRPDGSAALEGTDRYDGMMAAAAKGALERLAANERRQAVEAMLARSFGGFAAREVTVEGEDDPEKPLVIRWAGEASDVARAVEGGVVVDALVFPARLGARYVQVAARRTALLVPTPERGTQRIELVAPEGLAPRAAPPARVETPFGTFSREERVEGRTLVREESLRLERARVSPDRYAEFAAFAAAVDAIQERPALFSR
jgi:tetratricopeptide (TPR) repeat protein